MTAEDELSYDGELAPKRSAGKELGRFHTGVPCSPGTLELELGGDYNAELEQARTVRKRRQHRVCKVRYAGIPEVWDNTAVSNMPCLGKIKAPELHPKHEQRTVRKGPARARTIEER